MNWKSVAPALILFLVAVTVTARACIDSCQGNLVYLVDDAYIYMALAKNLAEHGVWSLSSSGFSSVSSSHLWTVLSGLIQFLAGRNTIYPFIVNIIFGSLVILAADKYLRLNSCGALWRACTLIVLVLYVPLYRFTMTGLEHVLHLLLCVLFLILIQIASFQENSHKKRIAIRICLVAVTLALTSCRYEAIALTGLGFIFLFARARRLEALLVALAAPVGPLLYSFMSVSSGSSFLPNSILIKAKIGYTSLYDSGMSAFFKNLSEPFVLGMLLSSLAALTILLLLPNRKWTGATLALSIFIPALLAHLRFGMLGWFFRYEAYLLGLSVIVISLALHEALLRAESKKSVNAAVIATALIFLILTGNRAILAGFSTVNCSKGVYFQHFQMARFLNQYYGQDSVVCNDIGVLAFFCDKLRILDIYGLESDEIMEAMHEDRMNPVFVDRYFRKKGARIALLNKHFEHLAELWTPVMRWDLPDNAMAGGKYVIFYALSKDDASTLKKNLESFQLPAAVTTTDLLDENKRRTD